jgi:hypothetical protein
MQIRHCPGARDVVKNRGVGLCLSCVHHMGQGAHMDAPAFRADGGVWQCREYVAVEALPTRPVPGSN